MATAGGFTRGDFEAAEVAQDIADREAQLRGSMDKTLDRAHRVGGFQGADVDENTLVETEDADLADIRKGMKEYNDYVKADAETSKMSPELQSLMRHMHSYATRYNVDLHRSLKENGGRQSADGQGAMSKVKFQSVLLSAFSRSESAARAAAAALSARDEPSRRRPFCSPLLTPLRVPAVSQMFKPHLLTEICMLYGTGPLETGEVAMNKNLADAYAGRLDRSAGAVHTRADVHLEVKWLAFTIDVGEGYMTFPPRGHRAELAK